MRSHIIVSAQSPTPVAGRPFATLWSHRTGFAAIAGVAIALLSAPADAAASIRLLAFSRVGAETEVNIADPEGKPINKTPITLPTQQLSPKEDVDGSALVFTSPADPKKILGRVALPAASGEFVLIFLPAAKGAAEPYRVDAVSLPGSEFGSGDYAFVNYSGRAVGCLIDDQKLVAPSGKATIYQMKKSNKGAGNRSMLCYEQKDGKWDPTPFFSSRIIIQEGVRNLVLICLDPRTGAIDFRGVADFVEGKS